MTRYMLAVLLLVSTGPVLAQPCPFVFIPKADSSGNDYTRIDEFSFEDCRKACANDFKCNAFTYNQLKDVCFLKTAPNQWLSIYAWSVTGIKIPPFCSELGN
jgi:hypothetical protein